MDSTASPKVKEVICVRILSNGASEILSQLIAFQCTELSEEQPEKTLYPMLVTLLGIEIEVSEEQS